MFYVSSYKDDLIGITDSEDDIEEFYTKEFLSNLNIEIIRFNKELPLGYNFETDCFILTLIPGGWQLECKSNIKNFHNNASYFGYPVISLSYCFETYTYSSIDIRGMNTSNVKDMHNMFTRCKSLESLDLSSFITSNVTDTSRMFAGCINLKELKLPSFNLVEKSLFMFTDCYSLCLLDLSNFSTKNIFNMLGMFYNCSSLVGLDFSSFDSSGLCGDFDQFSELFENCTTLALVKTNDLNLIKYGLSSVSVLTECNDVSYNSKIRVKKGTKFEDIVPRLLLTINKNIIKYEEVD